MNVIFIFSCEKPFTVLLKIVLKFNHESLLSCFFFSVSCREPDVKLYAGNGDSVRKYGLANMASFGQPSSIVAEGNSLIVCDTGVNAITLVSSMKPLYLATQQFSSLYDAFGVHSNNKHIAASDALQAVENSLHFYRKCQADVRELFELGPNKSLDGSLGSPSHKTVNSLAMVQRGLKEAIDDLSDMSERGPQVRNKSTSNTG